MRRIVLSLFGLLVVAAAIFAGLAFTSGGVEDLDPSACRSGDVLDGVHDPERIQVIDPCVAVRGTVAIVRDHDDGDWDIGLIPDPPDLDLLGRGNLTKVGGLLVVEVIPKDQATVKRPRAGSRVEVIGAYVIDAPNGWREIHPAWSIEEISASPVPPGAGQDVRSAIHFVRRALLRLRASLRELLG